MPVRTRRRASDRDSGRRASDRHSRAELRQLSSALDTAREEERSLISRELHDDPAQLLATVRIDLALLMLDPDIDTANIAIMKDMDQRLLDAITSLRRIATNLRPRVLDGGGLYFALRGLEQDFSRRTGIGCDMMASEHDLCLDDVHSTGIYRIVQEALTNIARHARAAHVWMRMWRSDAQLRITIRDDGRGISDADMHKSASLGLVGMRERVWGMNGEINIGRDTPGGTRIDVTLPVA